MMRSARWARAASAGITTIAALLALTATAWAATSSGQGHAAAVASTVTLTPGQTAHAVLQYIQDVATNCPLAQQVPAYELQVSPPNRTAKDHALFDFETCPGSTVYLTVTAVRSGIFGT